jgi:hypothetical protein
MSYENVKFLLKDKNNKYLVGRRIDSLIPFSAIGGKKESSEKDPLVTLNRELMEETLNLLKLQTEQRNLFMIADNKVPYPIQSIESVLINKQYYILMKTEYDLSNDIVILNQLFRKKQNEMINNIFSTLRKVLDPKISDVQIFEWILRFKNNYQSPFLNLILINCGFKESEIKTIVNFLQTQDVFLEKDGLDLIDFNTLRNGLFEKGFFLVKDQKFLDFLKQ